MKKSLINRLGLIGLIALLSYTAAVVFSPMAYPGYNWMAQPVSDLSAETAPSRQLWGQLSVLYDVCAVLCSTLVCVYIQGKLNKTLRTGIYLFTVMNWVSRIGYGMFPESESGLGASFQDVMHLITTALVVLLSIVSLVLIMIGGFRDKKYRSLAVWSAAALLLMFAGAVGVNIVPLEYFGIPERFSTFAAVGFGAVLGVYMFRGFGETAPDAAGD